jgi:RNA recognition motif-containing protein
MLSCKLRLFLLVLCPSLISGFAPSARFGVTRQTSRFVAATLWSEVNDVTEGSISTESDAVETSEELNVPELAEDTVSEAAEEPGADEEEENSKPEKERFTMFVGNVPFETMENDLRELFSEYGTVELVNLPRDRASGRSRGFAFVDMASKNEVTAAIDGLNGVLVGGRAIRVVESVPKEELQSRGPQKYDESAQKIYVGNIPFQTQKEDLMDFFSEYGGVREVYIPFDTTTGNQRGFAFVTMDVGDAEKAIEKADGASFFGRTITVSKPLPRGQKAPSRNAGPPSTKMYVGNLSFYTELDTVMDMFEEFGEVIDAYMPEDRETGGSRGFAFVTMSAEDAKKAIDNIDGCELDGRILRVNEAQPKGRRPMPNEEETEGQNLSDEAFEGSMDEPM